MAPDVVILDKVHLKNAMSLSRRDTPALYGLSRTAQVPLLDGVRERSYATDTAPVGRRRGESRIFDARDPPLRMTFLR
jgi:hypothetical protein